MTAVVTSVSNGGPISQVETPRVPLSARSEGGTSLEGGVTQVHAAAVNGDRQTLARLLAMAVVSEELDVGDQFGRSPLMYCVLADRPECAEILIKAGAQVNLRDKGGRTALHWAAHKGNLRLMKLLLTRGADCREKDNEGQTALHLCTRHKLPKVMALLLRQLTPGEIDDQDKNKRTALHWAASHGNLEHVKMLIKQNSNIGIPDTEGKTPLHWAASSRDREAVSCVKLVLETTPSVINWQDYEGRTALHLAVADGNESVVNVLTSVKNVNVSALDNMFRTPLHWAAVLGHSKIVAILLDSGADSASSDANGATALHYAAQNNFSETVCVFLERFLTDEPDLEGRTAFMWAAGTGADSVIIAFLSAGVDLQQEDKTGGTALHAASLSGHSSTVKLLLDCGARLERTDQAKHTPLFRACEMGHMDVVQTLIDHGARVDGLDQDGRSPLHWAALGGHAYICQMLIKYGDDPNVRDHSARAPLHCAAYGGFVNCMSALMEHGAEPNSQDREGMTCLHWACSKGHLDAVKLLIEYNAFPNHMEFTEDRYTPLDYALMGEHHEVAQYMIEQGALSITGIQDIAAQKIQCAFRGYRVRKAFTERKKLLMKHEKLKKEAARKRAAEEGKKVTDDKKTGQSCGGSTVSQSKFESAEISQDTQSRAPSQEQDKSDDAQQEREEVADVGRNKLDTSVNKLPDKERGTQDQSDKDSKDPGKPENGQGREPELTQHQEPKVESEGDCYQQQQQQQEQEDAQTEMLKRKRLKMRKCEERRRRLLEQMSDSEQHEQQQQQHHKQQEQQHQIVTSTGSEAEKCHLQQQQQQQQQQGQQKKSPELNEQQQQQQQQKPHTEERQKSEKHRSRSRRRKPSNSTHSPSTSAPLVEAEAKQSMGDSPVIKADAEPLLLQGAKQNDAGQHRQQKSKDHKAPSSTNHPQAERDQSPLLPPSPRKEPSAPQPPRKVQPQTPEDTHLPPLVLSTSPSEMAQPCSHTSLSPKSPKRRRNRSRSASSSPLPSSRHRHHRCENQESKQEAEGSVDVTAEQIMYQAASPSPDGRGHRRRHRRQRPSHEGSEMKQRDEGGSMEKPSDKDTEKTVEEKREASEVNQQVLPLTCNEQQEHTSLQSENRLQQEDKDLQNNQEQKEIQQQQQQQQQEQNQQQLQQQRKEEEVRKAQIRKRELSKRYQGERMHSSHRDRQCKAGQGSPALPPDTSPDRQISKSPRRRRPPEPNEQERILAGKTQTHNITQNERKRREEFQRKVEAASTIQRAWRRHRRTKSRSCQAPRSRQRASLLQDYTKANVHKKRLRATQEEWERQIAALTIQLAWRKFFRRKLLKALHPNRRQLLMWDPEIVALKQQALVHYIYNEHIEAPFWHPTLRPAIRPLWTRFIPSAAAVSYNFAVDQYVPWVARSGAIPECPTGYDPVTSEPYIPPPGSNSGSARTKSSDGGTAQRSNSHRGSRSGSERGAETTAGRQQKSATGNKTKSAKFSYNMRKKT